MASTSKSTSSDTRLSSTFAECARAGRSALVVYATAGYPTPDVGIEALVALADAGADVLELGVPFSDPLADGPTIQASSFQAIANGVDLAWTLELLRRFRAERDTPVVVFSYLNPILRYGVDRFLADALAAGADGVLVTDLPLGTDDEMERAFAESPLDLVRLVAPTTRPERVREIAESGSGFLYYVSRTGVTGARQALSERLAEEVTAVRSATDLPVAVGFGISTPEQARTVAGLAEGVVVGSAVVERLGREGVAGAAEFVKSLRAEMEEAAA